MPLNGLRVLDLTRLLPGAHCTMMLADMGADVVKVEDPATGDYMRWMPPLVEGQSALFNAINRNKRSLALNLKSGSGRELFLALAKSSDAVVEGNRPGVMARLGLGWEVLHALQPRLVMCSITGYGQQGPFANRAGHDINYMAVSGGLSLNGPRGGGPIPLGVQVADLAGGGVGAAAALLGALLEVARGGEGRHLDVSMTDGALSLLAMPLASLEGDGSPPERGQQRLTGRYACYRVYECDGGGHYSVGALEPKFWSALCDALGRPDLVGEQYAEAEAGQRVHAEMEAIFRTRSRAEWEQVLQDLEVCCEPVLDLDEVAAHPQVAARGMVRREETGLEVAPAVPAAEVWRHRGAPALGEHTAEILAEVGVDDRRLRELREQGCI